MKVSLYYSVVNSVPAEYCLDFVIVILMAHYLPQYFINIDVPHSLMFI